MEEAPLLLAVGGDPNLAERFAHDLRVTAAGDATEALQVLDRCGPDLVLLEAGLCDLGALELYERVRRSSDRRLLSVLLIAGSRDPDESLANRLDRLFGKRLQLLDVRRLERAQSRAGFGSWELDLTHGTLDCSEALLQIFAVPRSLPQPSAADLLTQVHGADRSQLDDAVTRALSEGTVSSCHIRLTRPDGSLRHLRVWIEGIRGLGARPIALGGTCQDVTDQKQVEEELRFEASHDSVTGLPNGSRFKVEVGRALREIPGGSILFLDLDHFSHVNETLGHAAGDLLLVQVAERILKCVRASDSVGRSLSDRSRADVSRLVGDEFTILLPGAAQPKHAARVAERILRELARPFDLGQGPFRTSATLGIVSWPTDGTDAETLLDRANAALEQAKTRRRGHFEFLSDDLRRESLARVALDKRLREALAAGEFELHYQPILELASGELRAAEALLRWNSADGGCPPPSEFLPVAEETGLIIPLGEWVLREACAQYRMWREDGVGPCCISVNVSGAQFAVGNFAGLVAAVLEENDMDPRFLQLEITETELLRDRGAATQVLRGLRDMGIRLALDDFGTGYSSLSYLRCFAVDTLKVDRSFVQDLPGDAESAAVSEAIISMAKALGLRVVAEGVESEAQRRFLADRHCDDIQGFLISRPLCAEAFASLFLRVSP